MLGNIVTHETQGINPFESLTSDGFDKLNPAERAEYDAWSDEVNVGTRDPEPSDTKPTIRRTPPYGEMTTARKFAYRQLRRVEFIETIADKLEEALALAHECAGELEAEYDSLPYYIDEHEEYEFNNPDHARAVDRQRQDASEIETQIHSLLTASDDWFVVGWSYRFFRRVELVETFPEPDDVQREIKAIEAVFLKEEGEAEME